MNSTHKKEVFKVEGMTCISCSSRIEKELAKIKGVIDIKASFSKGIAECIYDENYLSIDEIIKVIEKAGYRVQTTEGSSNVRNELIRVLEIGLIIYAIYSVMKYFGLTNIFYIFPEAKADMEYSILFILGMFTSIHCIAMCGGINLSQCLSYRESHSEKVRGGWLWAIKPSLLYNGGRVISYTLLGGIIGGLGSVISFSATAKGTIQIIASIFMVIMGLNMLNIFPWLRKFNPRMPKALMHKFPIGTKNSSPLYIGMLNGLMPCGPLQAMQLYALSTGDPLKGAFSMFLFSIGTVPLMLGLGVLSTVLSHKFSRKIMSVGAVLVIILGISMFNSGLSLSGIAMPRVTLNQNSSKARIEDGIQIVETTLMPGQYSPITVQKGIPVKWIIKAEKGSINGCNNRIFIPQYNIEKRFQLGENIIEFTPEEEGTFTYSCWMGMIGSYITVTK